jgi:ribosomal protein S18 acetylase RimI-like enzyme
VGTHGAENGFSDNTLKGETELEIVRATPDDCLAIAELAQIAGDDMPGHFWQDSRLPGQSLEQAGAEQAKSATANFSYRNTLLARVGGEIAGMLLAYRLPAAADNDEDPADFPDFVRPIIELEQCVPESFYINMLAAYPRFRGQGIGSALMAKSDGLAIEAGCELITLGVFETNTGALRLYRRLGFELIDSRPVVASAYHEACDILLLGRPPREA